MAREITSDTVVAITGASSGIGRALAVELARRGARVGVIARRSELLEEVARECKDAGGAALPVGCDITDRTAFTAAIDTIVERFGHLDVLVNNAGRGHFAYIDDTPDEQIESVFRVNLFALWYGTTAALRHMRARGSGLIVNVSSIAGKVGYPGNAAYVAAKHATVGFSRALRTELAETGVEVMTVIPAGVMTDWAMVTEGGPMLEIFDREREGGEQIARERGLELPPPLPLLSAREAALAIVDGIIDPTPELYTHPGARDLALQQELDVETFEREQTPFWLANRDAYASLRR